MKPFYTILMLLVCSLLAKAQTAGTATLYAYQQTVLTGAMQSQDVVVDIAGGKEEKLNLKPKRSLNYWLYITAPSRIYPVELWIKGERYAVKAEKIANTPVTYDASPMPNNPKMVTLVPKTTQNVWLLTALPATEAKEFKKAADLAKKAELVVVYKMNGRFYYQTARQFTTLSAAALP